VGVWMTQAQADLLVAQWTPGVSHAVPRPAAAVRFD
jgi:hypothetical protein